MIMIMITMMIIMIIMMTLLQDRTWSLDWRTVACSPACSYPGDYNSYFHRPQIHGIYSGSSQYFFKSIKVVLFLGAAIAGSINPVKFYYDIGETRHTFSYLHVEKNSQNVLYRRHGVLHMQRRIPSTRLSRAQVPEGGEVHLFS